jgi:glycosyltransferase involved in cell wall biosynthesis
MKILIANYRYFISSGPERYLFNISEKLEAEGHTVMPFSIQYAKNVPSAYSRYFVSPIGGPEAVYFDQHRRDLRSVYKGLSRTFYSREVEQAARRMVDETQPDIAYVLYYLRKLSPSLLVGLKRAELPIVVRISDYGMFCPEHHLLRGDSPCTLCQTGSILNSVRHKCVKGSRAVSAIDAAATLFHRWRGYFDLIDQFVTTNEFMSKMMVEAGFAANRITCIPTFTDLEAFSPAPSRRDRDYLLYVGRLDKPKGVHVLISAMLSLAGRLQPLPQLRIAGTGHGAEYVDGLKRQVAEAGLADRIVFEGNVEGSRIPDLMRGAIACIMPAIWFENLPNSVVESLACGCPVIASDIGSLSYTVTHGLDGLLFRAGDAADLAGKIEEIVKDPALRDRLAEGARKTAAARHNPTDHVAKLTKLFTELAARKSQIRGIERGVSVA